MRIIGSYTFQPLWVSGNTYFRYTATEHFLAGNNHLNKTIDQKHDTIREAHGTFLIHLLGPNVLNITFCKERERGGVCVCGGGGGGR